MKVHSININYNQKIINRKQHDTCPSSTETLPSASILNYLNMKGIYNLSFLGNPVPIYSIDKYGKYNRYTSLSEAAKNIGISDSYISKCLNGTQILSGGHGFIYASEIEDVDENGQISLNHDKLTEKTLQVRKAVSEQPVIRPFYAVDKEGKYIKFERNRDAVHSLNVSSARVKDCLEGRRDTSNGYAFFYADEVETVDENGNITVNINIPVEKFNQCTRVPVYSVSEKGQVRKFSSMGDAASSLSVSRRNIEACLKGERDTASSYAYIRADEVESVDENGKVSIDYKKLNEKYAQAVKSAVYLIDEDGIYKRYSNSKQAAEALGVSEAVVVAVSNGTVKSVKSHSVVKAAYVESLSRNGIIVNEKLLKQSAFKPRVTDYMPVWAVDSNKHKKKYKNIAEAAKVLGLKRKGILACLNGEQKTTFGYHFVYADDAGSKNRKADIIYVIDRGGDYREFKNVTEAANALGISPDEILDFLKQGKTKDKQTSINGYVFALGSDE